MKIGAVEKSREGFDQGEGRHLHIRLLHLHIGLLRAGHHLHIELASPSVYHKGHRLNSLTPLSESCQKNWDGANTEIPYNSKKVRKIPRGHVDFIWAHRWLRFCWTGVEVVIWDSTQADMTACLTSSSSLDLLLNLFSYKYFTQAKYSPIMRQNIAVNFQAPNHRQ